MRNRDRERSSKFRKVLSGGRLVLRHLSICKSALGKKQAKKKPRVSGAAVQEEGLMWSPLCKQGSHFSRSEKWSVKREEGFGSGKGLMGGLQRRGWKLREFKRMLRKERGLARCGKLSEEQKL